MWSFRDVKLGDRGLDFYLPEAEEALRWALSESHARALGSGRVSGIGTTPDRRFLVTAGTEGTARLWDLAENDPAMSGGFLTNLDEGPVSALALSNDQRWLLTQGMQDQIFLRDLVSKEEKSKLIEEDWFDAAEPFSPDSRWLVTHKKGEALLRDLKLRAIYPLPVKGVQTVAYSQDSKWLATASASGSVELWDLQSSDPTMRKVIVPEIEGRMIKLEFSPDGHQLMGVREDSASFVWGIDFTGRPNART